MIVFAMIVVGMAMFAAASINFIMCAVAWGEMWDAASLPSAVGWFSLAFFLAASGIACCVAAPFAVLAV